MKGSSETFWEKPVDTVDYPELYPPRGYKLRGLTPQTVEESEKRDEGHAAKEVDDDIEREGPEEPDFVGAEAMRESVRAMTMKATVNPMMDDNLFSRKEHYKAKRGREGKKAVKVDAKEAACRDASSLTQLKPRPKTSRVREPKHPRRGHHSNLVEERNKELVASRKVKGARKAAISPPAELYANIGLGENGSSLSFEGDESTLLSMLGTAILSSFDWAVDGWAGDDESQSGTSSIASIADSLLDKVDGCMGCADDDSYESFVNNYS